MPKKVTHVAYGKLTDGTPFDARIDDIRAFIDAGPSEPVCVYVPAKDAEDRSERLDAMVVDKGDLMVMVIQTDEAMGSDEIDELIGC